MVETETPWHAQDEYWETLHPLLFDTEHREKASEEVDKLLSLLQLDSEASILDLCCGIGRHSLELAKRGFHVVGVDKTQKFVQMAKEKAENKDLDVEFIQDDMRDFCKPHAFDAVINMYTSFGYFKEKASFIILLRRCLIPSEEE